MANKVGKPLKFKTPKILKAKIDAFFKECDKKKQPYTITGLALALDTTRETLLEYEGEVEGREKSEEYADTIKTAKLRCQNYAERMLYQIRAAGPIFALKNYGWKDNQSVELTTPVPLLDNVRSNNSIKQNTQPEKED